MIETSEAYRAAVMADTRRCAVRVETDVADPDIVYTGLEGPDQAAVSVPSQTVRSHTDLTRYATLERNLWVLDGKAELFRDDWSRQRPGDKIGFVSEAVSGTDGSFSAPMVLTLTMEHPSLLQAASVVFSADAVYGLPTQLTVEVWANGLLVYGWSLTDNTEAEIVSPEIFEAYQPEKIVVTVYKWSLAGRRLRLRQILPGTRLTWTGDDITDLTAKLEGDPSCVSLPYGTASLGIDNSGRVFEPRNKDGFFKSIQARQQVEIFVGVQVPGGDAPAYEYHPIGKYYQHSGGWSTSDNGLSLEWSLVDIIGLVADREWGQPAPWPKTLNDWVGSIVAALGISFVDRYAVDEAYRDLRIGPAKKTDLEGIKCGDLLRYLGQATGTWPRADQETGDLVMEPLWDQGVRMSLDNMPVYPTISENDDIGEITITLADAEETKLALSGTNPAASRSISVNNPFLTTEEQALTVWQQIVTQYGGNAFDATWRGDPSAEIGDVVTLELDEHSAASARLVEQTFDFSSGVLAGCKAALIQPIGIRQYENQVQLTESGSWTVPEDVYVIHVVLVSGGDGGYKGDPGSYDEAGDDGEDGAGGKVLARGLNVLPGQVMLVTIGAGGAANGGKGGVTTFGPLSAEDGRAYTPSYTDIASGRAFGRIGVKLPRPGSGDGGKGGKGGAKGQRHEGKSKDDHGFVTETWVVDVRPGKGENGSPGASGCVMIYWDR